MSIETTREVMDRYLKGQHLDASMMAEDVVYTLVTLGQEYSTREGVQQMLHYFYRVVFDASYETKGLVIGENNAALEGVFIGKHTGEFAGIPATGNTVNVPLNVFYDIEDGYIKRARVYLDMMKMMTQLGVSAPSAAQA